MSGTSVWLPGHAAEIVDRLERQIAATHLAALPDPVGSPVVEPPD